VGRLRKGDPTGKTMRKLLRRFLILVAMLVFLASLPAAWIFWGSWPVGKSDVIRDPAILIVLGGGDQVRIRETVRLAAGYPAVPILLTGDSGYILNGLIEAGLPESRIEIEPSATSTWENATFSKPWLTEAGDGPWVLVTNDFHAPRARAVFRKVYPQETILVSCEVTTPPYNRWETATRRRERSAALYYLLRYGVWCFGS
jgi:uncharacterized SAM-binding protein YcdF (DUF218 family)